MIDSTVTVGEMRVLRDLVHIIGDSRLKLPELQAQLLEMGHVFKGGLSRWLTRVEAAIGGKEAVGQLILERNHNGSWLTPEGKKICSAFGDILRSIDDEIGSLAKNHRQRIRIGLTNSLTANLLPRVLLEDREFAEYFSDHPSIDLKVVEGEPHELERHVDTGWVDFAIGPTAPKSDAMRIAFHDLKRVLIFNPLAPGMAKLARFAEVGDFDENGIKQLKRCLADITLLIPPKRVMPELEKEFLPWPIEGRRIKLPQASLRRAWALDGLGAAITHDEIFSRNSSDEENNLVTIDLSDHIGRTTLWFYFKGEVETLGKPAQKLIQAIQRVFPSSRDQ